MFPYGIVVYRVVSEFADALRRNDVSAKIKGHIRSRASLIGSWWSCVRKKCDYYQVYQAYGPADLTHLGYHAAERLALEHLLGCERRDGGVCEDCEGWAVRLRGEFWAVLMKRTPPDANDPESKKGTFGFHQS